MRYNALRQIGLTDEQIKDNLIFTAEKIGLPMATASIDASPGSAIGVGGSGAEVVVRVSAIGR